MSFLKNYGVLKNKKRLQMKMHILHFGNGFSSINSIFTTLWLKAVKLKSPAISLID